MKMILKFLSVSLLSTFLFADVSKEGTLSVLLFHNGTALSGNEVMIDGKRTLLTDEDGLAKTNLSAGGHQIEIYGKDKQKRSLGYFKKQIIIKEGKDTQVIASLTQKGTADVAIDVPVKSKKNDEAQKEVATTGTGTLTGTILSSEGGTPIEGARIFIRGTSVDTRTDASGRFSAKVPSGAPLSISVVHSAYSAQTVSNISVKKDGLASRTIKLTPASMELDEFVVLAPKIEGSITDVMAEEKEIHAVANILGSEEISKKGDSDAAAALKRVTGVTLIGGKSVYVRGLGERYSNVELNSLPLPSPDPTKRVVPLDIFPSSMIGSMKVQKSGTADIPANFGGGYIDLRTKNKTEDDYIKIGLGVDGNIYTGTEVVSYQGSDTDWLGFDDGYRDIPSSILEHSEVVVGERLGIYSRSVLGEDTFMQMTKDYAARNFNISEEALPVGGSFSIEGLKNIEIDEENKLSIFGSYSYSQDHKYREEHFYSYRYDNQSQPVSLISDGYNSIATSTYTHGLMLNADYSFSDVFNIKYTKMFTHIGEKSTRETEGVFGSDFLYQYYTYLDWEEKTLNVDQLTGEFDYELFNKKNTLAFGLEYATALLDQPNNLLYQDFRLGEEEYERAFYPYDQNFLGRRLYSEDEVLALYLNNKIMYGFFSEEDYMQFGINVSSKTRVSEYQKFFLNKTYYGGFNTNDDYASLPGGNPEGILDTYVRNNDEYYEMPFLIKDLFKPADYFDAQVDETDLFFNMFAKPYDKLEFLIGARYVNLTQTLFQYVPDNYLIIQKESDVLEINDIYPSLGLKYNYNDKNIFDFALSRTFIIPDLREFSSGSYFHPYDVATVQGNPELINTDIYSADFKYSYFFSDNSEYIKLGAFYKYLDKPIEDTQEVTSSLPIYSFDNSDFATLYGIELDVRKSIDFLSKDLIIPYIGELSKFYIAGNLSLSDSVVTLREEQLDRLTSNNRQLQGLSNTVYNLAFGYDDDNRSVTLSYNKMGERIRKVGIINQQGVHYGDTYEIPPQLLDFVWIERLDNGFTTRFKIGNILDSQVIWEQDGKTIREYQTGQTFVFDASYKF